MKILRMKINIICQTLLFILFALSTVLFVSCGLEKGVKPVTPTRFIYINGDETRTSSREVLLNLHSSDGPPIQMYITNTSGCASGGTWEPYNKDRTWTLSQTNGTANVYVKFKYQNDTTSDCLNDSIVFGPYGLGGMAYDVQVNSDGKYAYVAKGYKGVEVYNVETAASPTLITSIETPGQAKSVYVSGNYLYVADYGNGMIIYDITTPQTPTYQSTYAVTSVINVYVSGNYAYLSSGNLGGTDDLCDGSASDIFYIIDVTTKSLPTLTGSLAGVELYKTVKKGDYIYGIGSKSVDGVCDDIVVIDVSTPAIPANALNSPYNTAAAQTFTDLAFRGDILFVTAGTAGVIAVDATTATGLGVGDAIVDHGTQNGIAISGDYAYMASDSAGLKIINVSSAADDIPAALTGSSSDTATVDYSSQKIVVYGNYAYIADGTRGFKVIDITTVGTPTLSGNIKTSYNVHDSVRSGNYLYVADNQYGIKVYDVTNRGTPLYIGSYGDHDNYQYKHVAISGNYLYAVRGTTNIDVIDVTTPATPTLSTTILVSSADKIVVSGSYLFVPRSLGLSIYSLATESAPALAGSYVTTGTAYSVFVSGNYAYLTTSLSGLIILDITIPSTPTLVSSQDTIGNAYEVVVKGSYAYVADGKYGITVIDLTTISTPSIVGQYHVAQGTAYGPYGVTYDSPTAYGIALKGNYLYVADGNIGVSVFDITTPNVLSWIQTFKTDYSANVVKVDGDYLYVADEYGGVAMFNTVEETYILR
ncbi:MAG: hypothetical protein HQK49_07710 [Oligoflexia bacterium]|nr:hypothetical protein [Oligoflexia bacterium]